MIAQLEKCLLNCDGDELELHERLLRYSFKLADPDSDVSWFPGFERWRPFGPLAVTTPAAGAGDKQIFAGPSMRPVPHEGGSPLPLVGPGVAPSASPIGSGATLPTLPVGLGELLAVWPNEGAATLPTNTLPFDDVPQATSVAETTTIVTPTIVAVPSLMVWSSPRMSNAE